MTARPGQPFEPGSGRIRAVTFTANGEYLVSGSDEVRVWKAQLGEEIVRMEVGTINCLAVSRDGRGIAAGTDWYSVFVWDMATGEKVFELEASDDITGVDFSPDSSRIVVASDNGTATVWDIGGIGRRVLGPLQHEGWVSAAKYSPQGDRIATATKDSVRVWDSQNGRLLVRVNEEVTPWYHTGLLWFHDHLFVVSGQKIKRLDAFTGSRVSEWLVPPARWYSCISLPRHGEFIAYSTNHTVTIWDTSTHNQLALIEKANGIRSIGISPDDRFLAIGGKNGKITVKTLSTISPTMHHTFHQPDIQVDDAILGAWALDRLADADALLTRAISDTRDANHHLLYCRALVRARLKQWDAAIIDAEKSIKIKPSILGCIAKSIIHACKGEKGDAYQACDIAFEYCHSMHVRFLLLTKAIVIFMAGEYGDAVSRVDSLIATTRQNSVYYVVQAYMYLLIGDSCMQKGDYEGSIQSFDRARIQFVNHRETPLLVISLISGWKFDHFGIAIRQRLCEALYAADRTQDAKKYFLEIINIGDQGSLGFTKWVSDFTRRCLSAPHRGDDTRSSGDTRFDESPLLRMTEDPTTLTILLREWTKATLSCESWRNALNSAAVFSVSRLTIYRAICEHLEAISCTLDASECFCHMTNEMAGIDEKDDVANWVIGFKQRCLGKLTDLGETAMNAKRHDDAIALYSAALALDLPTPQGLLISRSKAYFARGSWEEALRDAEQVIMLDPSSPWGYERKHAVLHKRGDYKNSINAMEAMLSAMSRSSDPDIRQRHCNYVTPEQTQECIRRAVLDAIRDSPRVLINTASGRLCDKSEQAAAFECQPIFKELISSMTTCIDHIRIDRDVTSYYRYATFSHKWEENEPLFEKVIRILVYDLEDSLTHDKLQKFCKIARDAGINWAWSDTCCINRSDHFVLQEAIVAMFKWYEGSTLTVIFLRGVRSPAQRGDLMKSIWNSRVWTFQEYHASKVVRFYTEDWKPYLDLDIPNHKEVPEIISEMEEATGISTRALLTLRPGLDEIRAKLCLAARRETTLMEDAAYSLLGIFSMSLPVVYGEGDKALGRLLGQLLTSSGDTSILAWTGKSGSFNSCLPAHIAVFKELQTTHVPLPINDTELDMITRPRSSSLNPTLVMRLYEQLVDLPVPLFTGQRMKLPCLTFTLGPISASRRSSDHVFRAKAAGLGTVEIRTTEDLTRMDSLTLVHPWIDFLLDRQPVGGILKEMTVGDPFKLPTADSFPLHGHSSTTVAVKETSTSLLTSHFAWLFGSRSRLGDTVSLLSPPPVSPKEKKTQAIRFITRLRQPFGALLFARTRRNMEEYRRVAAESVIRVQIQDSNMSLSELIKNARVLDVL